LPAPAPFSGARHLSPRRYIRYVAHVCAPACRNSGIALRSSRALRSLLSVSFLSFVPPAGDPIHACSSFGSVCWLGSFGAAAARPANLAACIPLCSGQVLLPGGFRCRCVVPVPRAGAGGSRLFSSRAIVHGGEAAPAARRGEEAAGDGQRRRRGVRPMDGVALQAAHHLGAPRRRLPSHVSNCPRILRLLSLDPRVPFLRGRKQTACLCAVCLPKYKSCQGQRQVLQ
jgi:hypothetical protein